MFQELLLFDVKDGPRKPDLYKMKLFETVVDVY